MSGLRIVTVINNLKTYQRCIKNNEFLRDAEIITFDNSIENIGIPKRYNSFINSLNPKDDFWVAFLHQDFIFNENPLPKLQNLDKNCIYGAIGIAFPAFFLQIKPEFIFRVFRRCMLGQIFEGEGTRRVGHKIAGNPEVETLDCCCCIVHSSLLKESGLRFDENLNFHMYVEDLCISAKNKGIKSKALQIDCRHLSGGVRDEAFLESVRYVKNKHGIKRVNSTCFK